MSDDYEERIRQDRYYTYKAWDTADDRRRLERQNEITRLGLKAPGWNAKLSGVSGQGNHRSGLIDSFSIRKKRSIALTL